MGVEPPDEVWVTADGRRLLVGEMDADHVRAALRMLIRSQRRRRAIRALNKQIQAHMDGELSGVFDEDRQWGNS